MPRIVRTIRPLLILCVAACSQASPVATDNPPALGAIGDQTTDEGVAVAVPVTITDENPGAVTVSATSANPTLVTAGGIAFAGSGATRTLTLTPAAGQTGSTTITVTATDAASQTTSTSFGLMVNGAVINAPPVLAAIATQTTDENVAVAVTVDITDETPASVTLTASSSNNTLVPPGGLVFSGAGGSRTLTITPAAGESGTTSISVVATDTGSLADTVAFTVNVTAAMPPAAFSWSEVLEPSDGLDQRRFGSSMRASGDVVAIGARGNFPPGKLYVFRNDNGAVTETWSTTKNGTGFGTLVALDGDYLASSKAAVTYLYARTGPAADDWVQEDSLLTYGPIDLSGDRLLLADFVQNAKVYTRSGGNWTETGTLDPGGLASDDGYGLAVAIEGDVAVVAAVDDDDVGADAGAVYVFRFNGSWSLEQKLTANDGQPGDEFGASLALKGDRLVIGAKRVDDNGVDAGAVYVFERTGGVWNEVAKIAGPTAGGQFGYSVDLSNGEFVVGAPFGGSKGLAMHYTGSGASWTGLTLSAAGATNGDLVGSSVAIAGDVVFVGAEGDGTLQGLDSGSVHVFIR